MFHNNKTNKILRTESVRLFIAVPVPPEIKKLLSGLILRLSSCQADVKWVEEKNLHLTLKFLGDTPVKKIDDVVEILNKSLEKVGHFDVEFSGIGAFPGLNNPRVLWLGVSKGGKILEETAGIIDKSLAGLGFPPETKKYSAHLTIGRVRSSKGIQKLTEEIEKIENFKAGVMNAAEIHLIKSTLTPGGAIYKTIRCFNLG